MRVECRELGPQSGVSTERAGRILGLATGAEQLHPPTFGPPRTGAWFGGPCWLLQPTAPRTLGDLAKIGCGWKPSHGRERDSRRALCPDSNQELLQYLSLKYERVHAVIGVNPSKTYAVSPYVRQELLRAMLKELNVSNVEVVIVCLS